MMYPTLDERAIRVLHFGMLTLTKDVRKEWAKFGDWIEQLAVW